MYQSFRYVLYITYCYSDVSHTFFFYHSMLVLLKTQLAFHIHFRQLLCQQQLYHIRVQMQGIAEFNIPPCFHLKTF